MLEPLRHEDILSYCYDVNHFNRNLGDSFLHLFIKNMMTEDTAEYIADRFNAIIGNNNEIKEIDIVFCHYTINNSDRDFYIEPCSGAFDSEGNYTEIEKYLPNAIALGFYVMEFMFDEEVIIVEILRRFIHAITYAMELKGVGNTVYEEQPIEDESLCCYKAYKWRITLQ